MNKTSFSPVENYFLAQEKPHLLPTQIPYITVENFPKLGLLTALRFIEWVAENPNGVISLPTGKTPEYFITYVKKIMHEWETPAGERFRKENGLLVETKPDFSNLRFVQIDEFYPISPAQHNSFYNYDQKFYVEGFGLDASKGLFINCDEIPLADGLHFTEVFPDGKVDLSLRYREAKTKEELIQQRSIFLIDNWCSNYENQIREMGGIGFFLGGLGPDGHIAFNVRGSDHYSTTRLTDTNFETQAVAAGDLGGIEISRYKPVITIGLGTITFNPDVVAIIFAAGEAKAPMIADALEQTPSNLYPASCLAKLPNARFYITTGAASMLKESVRHYYLDTPWDQNKTDRAVIDLCNKINKFGDKLQLSDLQNDEYCKMIPDLSENTIQTVIDSLVTKIKKGTASFHNEIFYHTGPHHDDILLGLLPHIHRLSREESNKSHFSIMTSGFNAVTNSFLINVLDDVLYFLDKGKIEMVNYPNFFTEGHLLKRDKDIYHYLINIASGRKEELRRGFSHRIVRDFIEIWGVTSKEELRAKVVEVRQRTIDSYDGEKMAPDIQKLKGMIRELEEELVWAFFGMTGDHIHHLRLGFYTGDIFTEKPNRERDVMPILEELRTINPSIITLAFDPEGSGPDTHYKVLQAIAEAVRILKEERDLSNLRIWGYRNVWYKFLPHESTHIVPVSLNAMGVMKNAFENCYLSQVDASFPSYKLDGMFCDLAKNIWVEQLKTIQLVLGKPFFFQNPSPRLRTTHGLIFFKEMNVEEFLSTARELERLMGVN